jgi:hypothetical protein
LATGAFQGRHVFPFASFVLVFSGAVAADRLRILAPWALRRLILGLAVFVGLMYSFAIYWNARRYAVGSDGPLYFIGHSRWTPPMGWELPLAVALSAGALMIWTVSRSLRPAEDSAPGARSRQRLQRP